MSAQLVRLNTSASNLANAGSISSSAETAYRATLDLQSIAVGRTVHLSLARPDMAIGSALTCTLTVLNLLERGLDHERGGDVAAALSRWYRQMRRAVLDQVVRPDTELLDTLVRDAEELVEAWSGATHAAWQ